MRDPDTTTPSKSELALAAASAANGSSKATRTTALWAAVHSTPEGTNAQLTSTILTRAEAFDRYIVLGETR